MAPADQRELGRTYADPLDLVWEATLTRLGIELERSSEVFASWDGDRRLTISTPDQMDPDDCLAQMVFHELCHALVAGPEKHHLVDWGLPLAEEGDHVEEHAANRLQAALAARHGLRGFFGTTTEYRLYYDRLPDDPLRLDGDPATPLARAAWERATKGPWAEVLDEALVATRSLVDAVRPFARAPSLWAP